MQRSHNTRRRVQILRRLHEVWKTTLIVPALTLPAASLATLVSASDPVPFTSEETRIILTLSPLDPAQAVDPTNQYYGQSAAIDFGKQLFFDKRLSKSGRYACATCHQPERGWADGTPRTTLDATLRRHTPSLWNVGYNRWFNWDGRVDSLWAQALGPIESADEMANDRVSVVRLLMQDETLRSQYTGVFGEFPKALDPASLPSSARPGPRHSDNPAHKAWAKLSAQQQAEIDRAFTNLGKAVAAFEATITSSDSAFDRFAASLRKGYRDHNTALSGSARRGLKLFVGDAKCAVCHAGPTFSDLEFHNIFLPSDNEASAGDTGRYDGIPQLKGSPFNSNSVHNDAPPGDYVDWVTYIRRTVHNRGQFKTPTLRNVAKTAPYMHTGQFDTLTKAIAHCSDMDESVGEKKHREVVLSPTNLTKVDIQDLVAFLKSLTDESYLGVFKRP